MMDPFSLGLDASIVRSVLVQRQLRRFPRVLNRSPISELKTPLRKVKRTKTPINFKKPIRTVSSKKKLAVPSELEKIILLPEHVEYCPSISADKRNSRKLVRNELNERNPYCHPVEGFRHNYRNVMETLGKVETACQLELPVHEKLSHSLKRSQKVKRIADSIYEQTRPNISSFIEKRQPNANHPDHLTPAEYQLIWREVERCKVVKEYKTTEAERIDQELIKFQEGIKKRRENIEREIGRIENTVIADQQNLFDLLRDLTREKQLARQMAAHFEVLVEEYGLIRSQLYTMMYQMDQCQVYRAFLHVFSPYEWQKEQKLAAQEATAHGKLFPKKSFCLDNLDDLCKTVTSKVQQPTLYFKHPEQIMKFFANLEDVSFTIYSHSKAIRDMAEEGTKYVIDVTRGYIRELDILREFQVELLNEITWDEKRIDLLKNFCMKFVFTDFTRLVFELESVKQAVEDIYSEVVASNDLNLGAATLMKAIELKVVSLIEVANPSDPENIRITRMINQESRLKDIARRRFEKTFREYEFILKGLRKSYDYTKPVPKRRLMARSPPKTFGPDMENAVSSEPDPERQEYEYYFGDSNVLCTS